MSQPPQLASLVRVSTHEPPQFVSIPTHEALHIAALHTSPLAHGMLQPPQFAGSLVMLVHVPLHWISPGPHTAPMQSPPAQISPAAHGMLHPPQFATSIIVSTQIAPQSVSGSQLAAQ
jgi:hypothetical protein